MIRVCALLLVLLAAPAAAFAQSLDCADAASQPEMNACAQRDYETADAELSRLYRQLRHEVGEPSGETALAAAERAWADWRDRECEFETLGEEGGSLRPMLLAECRKAKTAARAAELRRHLACRTDAAHCPW